VQFSVLTFSQDAPTYWPLLIQKRGRHSRCFLLLLTSWRWWFGTGSSFWRFARLSWWWW